eukprot:scaffold1136_cov260-Pinguiococcus_pyrenoidosus.AAC.20
MSSPAKCGNRSVRRRATVTARAVESESEARGRKSAHVPSPMRTSKALSAYLTSCAGVFPRPMRRPTRPDILDAPETTLRRTGLRTHERARGACSGAVRAARHRPTPQNWRSKMGEGMAGNLESTRVLKRVPLAEAKDRPICSCGCSWAWIGRRLYEYRAYYPV